MKVNVKILICTLIFATVVKVHCRRIIDLDNIRFSFDPYREREDESGKEQSEDSFENHKGKPEEPIFDNKNLPKGNESRIDTCHKSNDDCSDGLKCCDSFFRCYRIMGNYICASFLLEGLGALKAHHEYQRDDVRLEN